MSQVNDPLTSPAPVEQTKGPPPEDTDDPTPDVDESAPELNAVDTPADLEVEDPTLEWSQTDEDLGEEGG